MRSTHRQIGLSTLVIALAMVVLISSGLSGQAQKQPVKATSPAEDDANKPEGFLQFTFPEDRDSREQLRAVMDYLEKTNVPWDVVTSTAQRLLDSRSDSFFNLRDAKSGKETGTRVSVKAKINDLLGTLPKEGRQVYELNYGPPAEALLKKAILAGYDKLLLAEVSQRYFHSKPGAQAAILLANMDLESGNYIEAAYGFQRILVRSDAEEILTPRILFKAAIAFKRAGDIRQLDQVSTLLTKIEKRIPREGLAIGRRTLSAEELKQELDRPFVLSTSLGDGLVNMRYGNLTRNGRGQAGTPFLEPSKTSPVNLRSEDRTAYDWINQQLEMSFRSIDNNKRQLSLPGFFPLTTKDFIIYRTYDGVYALAARDGLQYDGETKQVGDICWGMSGVSGSIYKLLNSSSDSQTSQTTKSNWNSHWQRQMPGLLFENAMLGSMSHDGVFVYYLEDSAVPPPQQQLSQNFPQPGLPQVNSTSNESSVLVAVNLQEGQRIWSLGGPEDQPMTEQEEEKITDTSRLTAGAIFLGAPLPLNGRLYVLYERKGQLKVMCLDPNNLVPKSQGVGNTPALVWVQNLGAPSTRVGLDSLRRIQPCYLSFADGVLVCPTNSGAVIGVDINARSLLWARYYGTTQPAQAVDPNLPPGVVIRGGFGRTNFQPTAIASPWERWRAPAPIIVGNKVVHAAYDSDNIQCLNLRTGEVLWSARREKDDLFVAGVFENKVVVVGRESVKAYDLNGGENGKASIVWQSLRIGTPSGHGAAGLDGLYYLPMVGNPDNKDSKDPQVWAIDVNTGLVKSKTSFRKKAVGGLRDSALRADARNAIGNLLFHDGKLISQSATELSIFPLIELKRQEMTRRLLANPNDPEGLFDRGELSLENGDIAQAVADFKTAQKHNPSDLLQKKLREKLYTAYTEMLRADFAASESILNEYEALCEVPIDSEDPSQKQRLMDEQIRRRGLYLSLLAKGREKQGKVLEAFKAYRAFAGLGDNKQLVSIFDEPSTEMRPDVWARGRIDSMIRNLKDPALQKPLSELVTKEWDSVRDGNDLNALRDFVKVFGPYFTTGREAQLLLGERLLSTNNEEDLREAQTLLMQLWATTEDRNQAARAVDSLARVMTRRGMMEDAVGLYSQLGSKYGDVQIRDGKTGAEIFGELITDKRLLPFLEPSRGPSSSRYNVEMQSGNSQRMNMTNSFTLRPEGEMLSFFKRYNLSVEANLNDQSVQLRVTDRVSGEERCKFTGLAPIQTHMGINQGPPTYRMSQVSGHLLLVTISQYVYCFDLAEKRELWRYNLMGESSSNTNANRIETNSEGEMVFYFEDGWVLRLGRSSVIQPNYVTLLTRDGLVTLDPISKEKLWKRSNVSSRAYVFGDAKHIFLVEGSSSRVFRAADGVQVQDVPDFSAVVNSQNKLTVIGRHVLLSEGSTSQPRVLRLYDPLTGHDVWKKSYPAKSQTVRTLDPELTGCLTPDGKLELLASRTGEVISSAELDGAYKATHLPADPGIGRSANTVNAPTVLLDADRVYLFLNRLDNSARNPNGFFAPGVRRVSYGNNGTIANMPVNGVVYAFNRSTGKRLWFVDRLFENQQLFTERFDELPVLVAANQAMDENNTYSYRVVVVDKQTGMLKYLKGHSQSGFFQSVSVDPKTRIVEFWRYDIRLRIIPEGAVAAPVTVVP
jgi:outer membrane protein assembly factor BamB/tetratricopeptide (TPR) repeat protein